MLSSKILECKLSTIDLGLSEKIVSLEAVQQFNNRQVVGTSRASASLNPKQVPHDAKEIILRGAEKAAAGRTLGLSEEEVLAAVSREYRRQKRQDSSVTMEDVERQIAQAGNSLADPPEIRGVGYMDQVEVDPFGQDQGQYATYEPGDKQYEEQERNKLKEELLDEQRRVSPDKGLIADLSAELSLNPEDRPEMAPKSVLTDALRQVEGAKQKQVGLSGLLDRVFGGSSQQMEGLAQVEGRLEDSIPNTGQNTLLNELWLKNSLEMKTHALILKSLLITTSVLKPKPLRLDVILLLVAVGPWQTKQLAVSVKFSH